MERLTQSEKIVAHYLVKGLTNKEIAGIIFVSHHTVKAHVGSILKKFDARNRTALANILGKQNFYDNNNENSEKP